MILHVRQVGAPEDTNYIDESYLIKGRNEHEVAERDERPNFAASFQSRPKLIPHFISTVLY
jgi:hypothetical protein